MKGKISERERVQTSYANVHVHTPARELVSRRRVDGVTVQAARENPPNSALPKLANSSALAVYFVDLRVVAVLLHASRRTCASPVRQNGLPLFT